MKANEAPEKLYIALDKLTEDGRTFVLDHRIDYPICTEYIRTDAFIEKAAKWLEDNAIEYWGTEAVDNGMMIDDFKKAMKL